MYRSSVQQSSKIAEGDAFSVSFTSKPRVDVYNENAARFEYARTCKLTNSASKASSIAA